MANRGRKRVLADFRRAPSGSAFQKCGSCGVSVAVALADMHVCKVKVETKKPKPQFQETPTLISQTDKLEQPRSAYLFFMETYAKTHEGENVLDIDRSAFMTWKKMSKEERLPYIQQAKKVDASYTEALLKESNQIRLDDDGADSRDCFRQKTLHEYDGFREQFSDDETSV